MDIPIVKQKEKYFCSEASAEMILQYYGCVTSCDTQYKLNTVGCSRMEVMDRCLTDLGLKCRLENGNYDMLRLNLENDKATMLRIIPDESSERHTVVLVDINDKIIVNDPSLGRLSYDKKEFLELWSRTNNLLLICESVEL